MRIDLNNRREKHQKNKKISIIFTIIFFALTLISVVCFIVFANYKIQLLMSVAGSIVSSIFTLSAIGFLVIGYMPNKYLSNLYLELDDKEEQILEGEYKLSDKFKTLKKGLSFLVIYIDKQEYYFVDESLKECLKEKKKYQFILKGNFAVGINEDE